MRKLVLILFSFILTVSCEKNSDSSNSNLYPDRPGIPGNDSLDINTDQIIDFVISYKEFATDDVPSSGGSIIGSLNPLHQNQLLYRENVGYLISGY